MITTANYLLIAYVNGGQYHFEYEGCGDMWEALEQFWHEDWECYFATLDRQCFAVDVVAIEDSKAIKRYEVAFEMSYFHHFYDHGHVSLDEFSDAIRKIRADLDKEKPLKNDVTSFFYYMWNAWSKEECMKVWEGANWQHFWDKWCGICEEHSVYGAAERFYAQLSAGNRDRLVRRALEVYDGDALREDKDNEQDL